ncbi:MAG: WYL domain-containing protein [Candidatus Hodarchaeota archaeon]
MDIIIQAMEKRKSLGGYYNSLYRKFSPYKIGKKRGVLYCLGYQYAGNSSSGPILNESRQNWRCFNIVKFKNLEILSDPFQEPRIKPWKRQTCIEVILKEVFFK